ncbi:MAG: FxsA family protein [Kiloniellales bacterium]
MILLFVFIVVPLAEIGTFIVIGERIGLWPTLAGVVLTAAAGAALLRAQGFAILRRAGQSLQRNELPVSEVFHGACLLCAGALLLTPGFLTDAVGLALFVPIVRDYLGWAFFTWLLRSRTGRRAGRGRGPDVIDAHYVELDGDDTPHDPPYRRGDAS